MINEHLEDIEIPIIANAPFGHGKNLFTFPIGVKATLDTNEPSLKLNESAVLA